MADVVVKKKWYQSKTLKMNAIFFLAAVVQVMTNTQIFDADIQIAIVAAANVGLRFLTSSALE